MTKYSFILLDKDLEDFLQQIQSWGVVDITRTYKAIDETSRKRFDLASRYGYAIRGLSKFAVKEKDITKADINFDDSNLLETVEHHLDMVTTLNGQKMSLAKEQSNAEAWGSFNNEDLDKLKALNLDLHFYCVAQKRFEKEWHEQYSLQVISEDKGKVYFVVLHPSGEEYHFPIAETPFPERSAEAVMNAIKENEKAIRDNSSTLLALQDKIDVLRAQSNDNHATLDLYLAGASSEKGAEGAVAVLEGFAPDDAKDDLTKKLDSCDVYYIAEEAQVEDNPPVKLKNNWFATLFEPIGNLYMLPKYGELDLTPFFAPFYMLFFGLCLGDFGYGLLLMIIGTAAMFLKPSFRPYAKLVIFLGLGAFIMPMLTGTFFGVSLWDKVALPQKFYDIWYDPETINIKMFWFALIFGVVQIITARLIAAFMAIKHQGWQHGIANIGWCVFLVWASLTFAEWQGGFEIMSATTSKILIGIAVAAIFLFSKITSNIIKRLMGGVVAVYDVTGVLGDILSYVRLFGLGAAGGILGLVMNEIALSLSAIPYVGWLLFLVMIIIGHCLVIFLSCLGAFVHPIRLTFVEFYKNAGFEGGGRKFNPMRNENN